MNNIANHAGKIYSLYRSYNNIFEYVHQLKSLLMLRSKWLKQMPFGIDLTFNAPATGIVRMATSVSGTDQFLFLAPFNAFSIVAIEESSNKTSRHDYFQDICKP